MCTGAQTGGKKVLDPLLLEFQAVVSHLVWLPGKELRPSARAASILKPRLTFLALVRVFDGVSQ